MKLLLVRLDGIGDALVCTPLIDALHAAGHELGIALSDRNAGIFAPATAVATHVLERIPWPRHGSTSASRARADAEIATQCYDAALIASEEPEAYALAAPVARRIGFTTGWAKPFKTLRVRRQLTVALHRAASPGRERAHEVEILFRLGAGFVPAGQPERDPARLRRWIASGPPPERAGVVVQAGAKWAASGVDDGVLRRMLAALHERGARALVAPPEAAAFAARFPEIACEVPAALRDWVAAIDAAAAVVTVDTGAAHLAGMLGVPVVDVFPDRGFDAAARRWRPWAAPSFVVRASEVVRAPEAVVAGALDAF